MKLEALLKNPSQCHRNVLHVLNPNLIHYNLQEKKVKTWLKQNNFYQGSQLRLINNKNYIHRTLEARMLPPTNGKCGPGLFWACLLSAWLPFKLTLLRLAHIVFTILRMLGRRMRPEHVGFLRACHVDFCVIGSGGEKRQKETQVRFSV